MKIVSDRVIESYEEEIAVLKQRIKDQEAEHQVKIDAAFRAVQEAQARKVSPQAVIEAMLGRGIRWYAYEDLELAGQVTYFSNAQIVLSNETLRNEVNRYMSDLVEEIATKATDYAAVERLRYSVNGVQCLLERLDGIIDPRKPDLSKPPDQDAYDRRDQEV